MKPWEDRGTDGQQEAESLTQDEVVLSQLGVPDLLVKGAAGVHVHVCHKATFVEFQPNLKHRTSQKCLNIISHDRVIYYDVKAQFFSYFIM